MLISVLSSVALRWQNHPPVEAVAKATAQRLKQMELLSPAGTAKLHMLMLMNLLRHMSACRFSLRSNAGNIDDSQLDELNAIKGTSVYMPPSTPDASAGYRCIARQARPDRRYRSTHSSCPTWALVSSNEGSRTSAPSQPKQVPNSAAVAAYRDMGFSRIVLGREASLEDIATIKEAVPEVELEVFVHGAMCMAYSGRCFLSAFLAGRSANSGDCAHSCRWDYRLREQRFALEESERPGQYYPVFEEDGQTTILSSKDLCMIDHLAQIKAAGVDSVKIEGRMKSLYYTATVTRAYRKALDSLEGQEGSLDWKAYRDELFHVSPGIFNWFLLRPNA